MKQYSFQKYISFFKIRFIGGLQYRAAALAGVATQFAWGLMLILMFRAFYRVSPDAFPMEFEALVSYIWLQQAFLGLFMSWYFDNDILNAVQSGNVAYELCRPIGLYNMWFTKSFAVRTSRALLRCGPVLAFAFLVPRLIPDLIPTWLRLSLPQSPLSLLLFLISMLLGSLLLVSIEMMIYISSFYTVSTAGLRIISANIIEFCSGALIPIPFFPPVMAKILSVLPFAFTQNTPFLIYGGHIGTEKAIFHILGQLLWIILVMSTGKLLMHRAQRRVIVQGG